MRGLADHGPDARRGLPGCGRAPTTAPPAAASAFNFEEASRHVPKPRELHPLVKQDMVPMDLRILSDELVPSDTDPSKHLRKMTGRFHSIALESNTWIHPFVLFTPADNSINQTPQRKGKAVSICSSDLLPTLCRSRSRCLKPAPECPHSPCPAHSTPSVSRAPTRLSTFLAGARPPPRPR